MNRVEQRKERASEAIREFFKGKLGRQVDLDSLPPEARQTIQLLISAASEEPEKRMRGTMAEVAKQLGLLWSDTCPTDHPYQARLDGQLFEAESRIAVVELETKNKKQIRGALLDLLAHPQPSKVLVIGNSEVCDAAKSAPHIQEVLRSLPSLVGQARVGVFTEDELKRDPRILRAFLSLQ